MSIFDRIISYGVLIEWAFKCPAPNCKVFLTNTPENHFKPNADYYLAEGTLICRDADTGEFLFDKDSAAHTAANGAISIMEKVDLPNKYYISSIYDYKLLCVDRDFPGNVNLKNVFVYRTTDCSIELPDVDFRVQLMIRDAVTVNGRLHTTDQDGVERFIDVPVVGNTLSVSSNAPFIMVVYN